MTYILQHLPIKSSKTKASLEIIEKFLPENHGCAVPI